MSSRATSPLDGLGEMIVGGQGSVTGEYAKLLPQDEATYFGSTPSTGTVADVFDEVGGSVQWFPLNASVVTFGIVLEAAALVGRYRMLQGQGFSHRTFTQYDLEYSNDDGATWSVAHEWRGAETDFDATVDLASPVYARRWRIRGIAGGDDPIVQIVQLWSVSTVGAGNQEALEAPTPAARRVLAFDPNAGRPGWATPDTANPDTSGAVLADVEAEVNELKATLRRFGILAE